MDSAILKNHLSSWRQMLQMIDPKSEVMAVKRANVFVRRIMCRMGLVRLLRAGLLRVLLGCRNRVPAFALLIIQALF